MLIGRSHIVRRIAEDAGVPIGEAPFKAEVLDAAWAKIVDYPLPEEAHEWVIGAFAGLLIEHFRAQYSFKLKELEDEYGASVCLVETRTGIRLFPFDTVQRWLAEQQREPFGPFLEQIAAVLEQHGLAPQRAYA